MANVIQFPIKGQTLKVKDPEKVWRDYIKKTIHNDGIKNIGEAELKAYLSIKRGKRYKIVDVCRSCRYVYISYPGKKKFKFKFEDVIYE